MRSILSTNRGGAGFMRPWKDVFVIAPADPRPIVLTLSKRPIDKSEDVIYRGVELVQGEALDYRFTGPKEITLAEDFRIVQGGYLQVKYLTRA